MAFNYLFFYLCIVLNVNILKAELLNYKIDKETIKDLSQIIEPKSRLLIKKNKKKIIEKLEEKEKVLNKKSKSLLDNSSIEKKPTVNKKNKLDQENIIIINFSPDAVEPNSKELKKFITNIKLFSIKKSITIRGYAQKKSNESTSSARRLSLKRALYLRSLILKNNFKIAKIYVKALGYDNNLEGNKDIVIVSEN